MRLTNANDIKISFIITDCGFLGSTSCETTLACLDESTISLLLLQGSGEERLALLSNHIVLYLQLIYKTEHN